jgi:hypothetical protein
MTKNKGQFLIRAAVAGIIGATTMGVSSAALADDTGAKGHCVGANSCKGKGGCSQKGKNECAGKNGCGGKGFLETTKAECEALAKKDKKVHFEISQK